MNKILLDWILLNKGKTFSSPRRRAKNFEIVNVDDLNERVTIRFEGRPHVALPLTYEMFQRALSIIKEKDGDWIIVGASVSEQKPSTIEGEIWKLPFPINHKVPYKTASHVCDFIVLADLAEYGRVINPVTGRYNQAIRLKK